MPALPSCRRILWMTWKDGSHPLAGGAEAVNEALAKRLAADGHEVTFLVGGFPGCAPEETRDGYRVIRLGNRYGVYWHAYRHYRRHLRGASDLVIDEINTVPFFARLYVAEKSMLFVHQLARSVWFHEMPFPLSLLGYVLEPLYLRSLRASRVVTVSRSTKEDLVRLGFAPESVHVIRESVPMTAVEDLSAVRKYEHPTILSLGAMRSMKRTLHILHAFEIAKTQIPELRLILAGDHSGPYGRRVLERVRKSGFHDSISVPGRVDAATKRELLGRSHLLAVTSVREGWGLVVTEANTQGTPAVVYDVHGLRDSVRDGVTGVVTRENTPHEMAQAIVSLMRDDTRYERLRRGAWEWSCELTPGKSYEDFIAVLRAL